MKKTFIGLVFTMLLLVGCGANTGSGYVSEDGIGDEYLTKIEGKLYYIPHKFDTPDFPKKYEEFLEDNPNLKIIDVEVDPKDTSDNSIAGYFIFTEEVDKHETN